MKHNLAILMLLLATSAFGSRVFNGSTDIITSPGNGTAVDIATGPMVMSFWFKPTTFDLTAEHSMINKWDDALATTQQYWTGIGYPTTAKVGFYVGEAGAILGVYGDCNLELVADQWYQVVYLIDPGTEFFGSPAVAIWVTSTVGSCTSSTAFRERRTAGGPNLIFGARTGGLAANYFAGQFAEVAIWNSLLSAGEVAALAHTCPGKIRRTSLVSYHPLWGASGAVIEPDLAGTPSLNGTLTGTTVGNHAPCTP